MTTGFKWWITTAIFSFVSISASAQLSPLALYSKCYAVLTNKRPPIDSVRQAVADGSKDPVSACMELIGNAEFEDSGQTKNNTVASRDVLNTLHNFHSSWFGQTNFTQSFIAGVRGTYSLYLYDQNEPALYITRSLFKTNEKFDSTLKHDKPLVAIRYSNGTSLAYTNRATALGGFCGKRDIANCFFDVGHPSKGHIPWKQERYLNRGQLVGIQNALPLQMDNYNNKNERTGIQTINIHQGGGILGNSVYRMVNQPAVLNQGFNGASVARYWSKAVFRDLLCRDLPVLRHGDALPFVDASSSMAFRQSQSCVVCHASIDRLAGVMRNHRVTYKGRARNTATHRYLATEYIIPFVVSAPAHAGWKTSVDNQYHLRPPIGQLYYRSYDGSLQFAQVNGSQQLGEALAQRKDLYVCAAKRYYEFFTGIRANINDIHDPAYRKELNAEDRHHRAKVIALGENLFEHQSLKQLIEEIMQSREFQEFPLVINRSLASAD